MSSFHPDERRTDFGDALRPSGAGADCSRLSFERTADLQCLEEVPDFRGPGQNEGHMDEIGAHRGAQIGAATLSHFDRSEEHTSELQSRGHLVCRLLLEKKKKK